jgi:cell division protein FtsQ
MRRVSDITIDFDTPLHTGPLPADSAGGRRRLRAHRRWISPILRKRLRRGLLAIVILAGGVGLPAWLYHSGTAAHLADGLHREATALSARAGFRVEDIFVEGRNRTPRDEIIAALQIQRGDPMFGIDLVATRQRLEELSWVKTATIERRLPNVVHLLITERNPIVLWQNQGRYYLVDRDGQVVGDEVGEYADLPLMVGEGAPDHAADLIDLLNAEPDLKTRVKAAQWVGDRRWNITLDRTAGGIDVRLPEDDPLSAWHDLAKMDKEQSLLERKVALIDMRLPDRLVLRAIGGAEESTLSAAPKHKPHAGKDA